MKKNMRTLLVLVLGIVLFALSLTACGPTSRIETTEGTMDVFDEVLIEEDGVAERGSFIVNPEGKIVAYEVIAGSVGRNADELFRRLQACQFVAEHDGEVCPAKWQQGAETLKPSLDLVGLL